MASMLTGSVGATSIMNVKMERRQPISVRTIPTSLTKTGGPVSPLQATAVRQ